MADAPLVRLTDVGRRFPSGVEALAGVSLDIQTGDFVSLLGPSGCGKSTLLRLIADLDPPTAGTIAWGGAGRPAPGQIGYVFQDPTLMPWATVADNVWLPLRLAGLSRAEVRLRIEEMLEKVGLVGFAEAYPRELSGGMRMRVSLARALITRPRLLLLDEPFAALDELTRFRLNEDLLALWKNEHCTVVFVTHSVFEAVFLAQRVVVMTPRPGRIATEKDVSFTAPRDSLLRTSAEFAGTCRTVSEALALAMDELVA
jgi:NitT/TauT family transport system ATP-binding protein